MNENKNRFKGAMWFDKPKTILLGGAGGISSWTYFLLMRSNNHNILVVDPDTVETHNLGGQFFENTSVGEKKVNAVYNATSKFVSPFPSPTGAIVGTIQDFFNEENPEEELYEYVITGFDCMEARRFAYDKWKSNPSRKLFIDGRLLCEQFEVYFVTPDKEEEYEKTLFSKEEQEEASCTFKQTSHFAAMIAGVIVQGFNSFLVNDSNEGEIYHLPFKYYNFGPTFTIEIT